LRAGRDLELEYWCASDRLVDEGARAGAEAYQQRLQTAPQRSAPDRIVGDDRVRSRVEQLDLVARDGARIVERSKCGSD
jgi:hypothetical protein